MTECISSGMDAADLRRDAAAAPRLTSTESQAQPQKPAAAVALQPAAHYSAPRAVPTSPSTTPTGPAGGDSRTSTSHPAAAGDDDNTSYSTGAPVPSGQQQPEQVRSVAAVRDQNAALPVSLPSVSILTEQSQTVTQPLLLPRAGLQQRSAVAMQSQLPTSDGARVGVLSPLDDSADRNAASLSITSSPLTAAPYAVTSAAHQVSPGGQAAAATRRSAATVADHGAGTATGQARVSGAASISTQQHTVTARRRHHTDHDSSAALHHQPPPPPSLRSHSDLHNFAFETSTPRSSSLTLPVLPSGNDTDASGISSAIMRISSDGAGSDYTDDAATAVVAAAPTGVTIDRAHFPHFFMTHASHSAPAAVMPVSGPPGSPLAATTTTTTTPQYHQMLTDYYSAASPVTMMSGVTGSTMHHHQHLPAPRTSYAPATMTVYPNGTSLGMAAPQLGPSSSYDMAAAMAAYSTGAPAASFVTVSSPPTNQWLTQSPSPPSSVVYVGGPPRFLQSPMPQPFSLQQASPGGVLLSHPLATNTATPYRIAAVPTGAGMASSSAMWRMPAGGAVWPGQTVITMSGDATAQWGGAMHHHHPNFPPLSVLQPGPLAQQQQQLQQLQLQSQPTGVVAFHSVQEFVDSAAAMHSDTDGGHGDGADRAKQRVRSAGLSKGTGKHTSSSVSKRSHSRSSGLVVVKPEPSEAGTTHRSSRHSSRPGTSHARSAPNLTVRVGATVAVAAVDAPAATVLAGRHRNSIGRDSNSSSSSNDNTPSSSPPAAQSALTSINHTSSDDAASAGPVPPRTSVKVVARSQSSVMPPPPAAGSRRWRQTAAEAIMAKGLQVERKTHSCDICQREFSTSSSAARHMRIHFDDRKFKCSFPGCTSAFTDSTNRKRHEEVHMRAQRAASVQPNAPSSSSSDAAAMLAT